MKKFLAVAALMTFLTSPAMAEDNQVSGSALSALGLGGMKIVSDEQGMAVRGMSSNAQATSMSVFSFVLFDPVSGNNITGNGAQFSRGTAENAGLNAASAANATTVNTFAGTQLIILVPPSSFTGIITPFSFTGGINVASGL